MTEATATERPAREAPARGSVPQAGSAGADGRPLPRLGDRDLFWLLLCTLALQALVWARIDGYALADSIEYLEHAQALVRGERVLDSSDIRGIGFALLLAPPFLVAELLGLEDQRWIVPFARLMQMLLALLLVRAMARIGATLAGRRAGLAAGLLGATSPVLLLYSVEPVADVLAALLIAQALLAALTPGGGRRGLEVGLWLGAALLIAFKSLLVAAPLALLVALRDLRGRPRAVGGLALGLLAGVALQVLLDRLRYGEWGRSLFLYLGSNGLLVGARIVGELGFVEIGRRLYELGASVEMGTTYSAADGVFEDLRERSPRSYYLRSSASFLSLPALALVALGGLRAVLRPRWARALPLALVAVAAVVLSFKGSKDFRLWLPLLPAVAALAALGFDALAGGAGASGAPRRRARVGLAAVLVLAGAGLSGAGVLDAGTRRHAGYWSAMELVNQDAARADGPLRVTSAWHWAVFLRDSGDVELVKLPHHLEGWERYGEEERGRSLEALGTLDRLITHLPVLTQRPELLAEVARLFAVDALLFDPRAYRDLGPVLVLARRTDEPGERVLFELLEGVDPAEHRRAYDLGRPYDFLRRGQDGPDERLRLLGFQVEPLRGGHSWLTLHWQAITPLSADLHVVGEVRVEPEEARLEQLFVPAFGLRPTSTWGPELIVREGRPLVAAVRPFDPDAPWRPLGAELEGERARATLWLTVFEPPAEPEDPRRPLEPARAGEDRPLAEVGPPGARADAVRGALRAGPFELRLEPTRAPRR